MEHIGYLILLCSMVGALVSICFCRDKAICLALLYFLCYEGMQWALVSFGNFVFVPYASLAVFIDWWFFYLFLAAGARIAAPACGFSLAYGGVAIIESYSGGHVFYDHYDSVAIAVSILIVIDYFIRMASYRSSAYNRCICLRRRLLLFLGWKSKAPQ